MKVSYKLNMSARCPRDEAIEDLYTAFIYYEDEWYTVEQLLEVAQTFELQAIYQEDLVIAFVKALPGNPTVKLIGTHSNVEVEVECTG